MNKLDKAYAIIKEFEGLRLKAYKDPVGIPTLGYGTIKYPDGSKVKMGDSITRERAEELLAVDCKPRHASMMKHIKAPLTEGMECALLSFCYNLGVGALAKSTLLKKLNAGQSKALVAAEFMKWVNAGGKPLKGLVRRREAERKLFLS